MFVRINGNMTERVGNYAVWVVECMNSDGEWQLLTACYGPMSLSSAVLIVRTCENEK